MKMRKLELLSPAANKEIGRQAILHGADAVYIGASSHGARQKASNSIEDIAELVEFAHQFRAKVYVTVNTLVYDNEIKDVEKLIDSLYRINVDALIVQDMGILRMKIPPISLHSSTQCDTRTVEKAKFLEESGFSQSVLARELTLQEISDICKNVSVPIETFIHGALCVCYSGRCQASEVCLKRSANRGECSQMCRLPYTLRNSKGEILAKDKYLLSLSDFNASENIADLIEAGVSSFKIEGRLKDASYVKNVTAYYRQAIDRYISENPGKYCRSSYGVSEISFKPNLEKSFNRGFTDYFLNGRGDRRMASLNTPKSLGERINCISMLHNGDGISFYNYKTEEYEGVRINKIEDGKIYPAKKVKLPPLNEIRRTFDIDWEKSLAGNTAKRKLKVDISIDENGVSASDERGVRVRIPLEVEKQVARKPMEIRHIFEKLGDTIYRLNNFYNGLSPDVFIPASVLTDIRRRVIFSLDRANTTTYPFELRRKENPDTPYLSDKLDSRDNVANYLSKDFYKSHNVKDIEPAIEIQKEKDYLKKDIKVMTTRYCLRRELGCCKKNPKNISLFKRMTEPLTISSNRNIFRLEFDCNNCEMNVIHPRRL